MPNAPPVRIRPPLGTRANCDAALDLPGVSQIDRARLHRKRRRHRLDRAVLARADGQRGIAQHAHSRYGRCDLLQQFQPFRAHAVFKVDETGGVAARPCQAIDESRGDGIGDLHEHNRHRAGHLQQGPHGDAVGRKDHIGRKSGQLGGVPADVVGIAASPAVFDLHVAAVGPAKLPKPVQERADPPFRFKIAFGQAHQHADAAHPLLRARTKWPRHRATEKRNEFAPLHAHRPHKPGR